MSGQDALAHQPQHCPIWKATSAHYPRAPKVKTRRFAVSLKVGTSLQELNPGSLNLASHATPAHLALVFECHTPLHCTPTPCLGAGMEELPSGARGVRCRRGGCSSTCSRPVVQGTIGWPVSALTIP